jgi:pyruvate formate lyase activating enzyme
MGPWNADREVNGIVFDIKRYAIHDGPGIRTTVFFKGCPLRCAWCQNPESRAPAAQLSIVAGRCIRCGACLDVCPNAPGTAPDSAAPIDRGACRQCGACVEACPTGARSMAGRRLSVAQLIDEVERDRIFFDESKGGVTFSGGEPLFQADFLLACLAECKSRGLHTALDTCGYAPAETMLAAAAQTDLFLYDLKLMDDGRHVDLVGVSNKTILENLRTLDQRGARLWIRIPLIPEFNDDAENLQATAAFVKSLKGPPPVHLLPFHRVGRDKYSRFAIPYETEDTQPPTRAHVSRIAAQLAAQGLEVRIGG